MLRSTFLLVLTVLVLSVPVQSQTQESTFFNNLRYRLVGPARGGRVPTVAGVPSQPKTFYIATGSISGELKVGGVSWTQPFNVLIDPRVAADGVTVADLHEQFEHNLRMRELVTGINQLAMRVREAQTKLRNAGDADANALNRMNVLAAKLLNEPVRYGRPGLQAHITYLAGMTASVAQKIGRDAIERYAVLKKAFDLLKSEIDRELGPGTSSL